MRLSVYYSLGSYDIAWHSTNKGGVRATKNRTLPILHQNLPPFLAAPPVFCWLESANRTNQKQLESTAAANTPGLTGLVQQVLRGEADTRLTTVSAHTDSCLTQDAKEKTCLHLQTPQSTNTFGI